MFQVGLVDGKNRGDDSGAIIEGYYKIQNNLSECLSKENETK